MSSKDRTDISCEVTDLCAAFNLDKTDLCQITLTPGQIQFLRFKRNDRDRFHADATTGAVQTELLTYEVVT
jgi:hypothetical protein